MIRDNTAEKGGKSFVLHTPHPSVVSQPSGTNGMESWVGRKGNGAGEKLWYVWYVWYGRDAGTDLALALACPWCRDVTAIIQRYFNADFRDTLIFARL